MFIAKLILILAFLNAFTYILALYEGIPYVLIILFVLVIGYTYLMEKTVPGRHIYAVGGNVNAAHLSGVKTRKMKFMVFITMGVLSALDVMICAWRLCAETPHSSTV